MVSEGNGAALDAKALRALTDTFAGQIVLPGDPEYDSARAVWNGMIDRRPAIVVRPSGAADVIAAIGFRAIGRDFMVRSS